MYLIIIILPLLSSVIPGFLGGIVGTKGTHKITSISIIITTILSMLIFLEVGINNIPVYIDICKWLESELYDIR